MSASAQPLLGRALITGGTSGLGYQFASQLADRGLDLVLVARDPQRLDETARELRSRGVSVETVEADLATQDGIDTVKTRLSDTTQPVTVFVNNAGHGLYAPLVTDDTSQHKSALTLMLWAMLELGATAGLAMKKRGYGHIINTASVSGLVPMGGYSAIKAWTRVYSESLYLQLKDHGVHVTTFMPGWVRTEFHARASMGTSNIPDWLWLDPAEIVSVCLRDAEKKRVRSTPSLKFKVISCLAERGPKAAVRAVAAKINKGRQ